MIKYRYDLYSAGTKIAEIPSTNPAKYGFKYNNYVKGSLSVGGNVLPVPVFNALQFANEVRIFRNGDFDNDFRQAYAGEIRKPSKSNNEVDIDSIKLDLYPVDKRLEEREFDDSYTSTEESSIFTGILNTVQNDTEGGNFTAAQADLGITNGLIETTGNIRTRTYTQASPLEVIQNLTQVNDIGGNPQRLRNYRISPNFTDDRYLKASYYTNLGQPSGITFTNEVLDKITLTDNSEYANHIIAYGKNGIKTESFSTNTALKDFYGKRTKVKTISSIETIAELQEYADEQLRIAELRPLNFDFELVDNCIFTGEFDIGDSIRVTYEDEYFNIDTNLTVFEIMVTHKDDIEKVKLKMAPTKPITSDTSPVELLNSFINNTKKEIRILSQ